MSQEPEHAAVAAMAPDEVPTPLATPLLPRAKRVKEDPAMAAEDWSKWSTLLPELLRLIAESFLGTNDVDCYVDFRAVCPSWRAATDDPKDNTSDRRFHPRRWIVLDEVFHSEGKLFLLNADTGRFVHRKLPLLSANTMWWRPLTVATSSWRTKALLTWPASSTLSPVSSSALRCPCPPTSGLPMSSSPDLLLKAAVGGGVYAYLNPYVDGVLTVIYNFLWTYHFDPLKFFSGHANYDRGFLVGLAGHMLLVFKPRGIHYPCVLRFDNVTRQLVLVQKIGKYAIFVGHQRCLAVDSDKFPGVEENCVYYPQHLGSSTFIYKCNIADKKVERISESDDFMRRDMQFVLVAERPFTIIHILSSYTINIPDSQLALQQMP
ncbi:hypothetical protein VPH35_012921 [Triticum aestivum]